MSRPAREPASKVAQVSKSVAASKSAEVSESEVTAAVVLGSKAVAASKSAKAWESAYSLASPWRLHSHILIPPRSAGPCHPLL